MKLSTIAAALTVLITSAYAAEEIIETFVLFGAQDATGKTPNYTQSIVVGSVPVHISKSLFSFPFCPFARTPPNLTMVINMILIANPLLVVSIECTVLPQHYNCTFVGVDGVNTTLGGTVEVDPPQAQVSLFCSSQYVP